MGLPVFVCPPSPTAASAVVDKSAAAPRSSIRRQRTVRSPHSSGSSADSRRRRMGDYYEAWESQGRRLSPPDEQETGLSLEARIRATRNLREGSRIRESFERQYPSPPGLGVDGPLLPAAPESRDYNAYVNRVSARDGERLIVRDIRRTARRNPAPTPPESDAILRRHDSMSPRPMGRMVAQMGFLTQREETRSPLGYGEDDNGESAHTSRLFGYGITPEIRSPISILSERVEAHNRRSEVRRRVEARRIELRRARIEAGMDGLGDRDRSLSPDGGAAAWDTLLTSITPDPQPPSVGSSFASASASASATASSNRGPASANTSMTSFGLPEELPSMHDCDITDSASEDEEDLQEFTTGAARGDRFWRTYADVVTARADRVAETTTGETEHLGGMHRIISRLAEREDIPESWWAGAGLRREPTN